MQRINFKLATLVHRSLHNAGPQYMSSLLHPYTPSHQHLRPLAITIHAIMILHNHVDFASLNYIMLICCVMLCASPSNTYLLLLHRYDTVRFAHKDEMRYGNKYAGGGIW